LFTVLNIPGFLPFLFKRTSISMAENKTKPTAKSVPKFLEQIGDPVRKAGRY
jgi:hypothetical protein